MSFENLRVYKAAELLDREVKYSGRKRYHLLVARGSSDEVRSILRRMASDGVLTEKSILRSCTLTSVIAKMLPSWIDRL